LDAEKIKIYRYYFEGIKQPLTIQAINRKSARHILSLALQNAPYKHKLLGETVTLPIIGVTTIKINGLNNLWVGTKKSKSGWQVLESK
jgi:hypothetical protein